MSEEWANFYRIMNKHEEEITKPGTIVKHFKRETADLNASPEAYLYMVLGICQHTETEEPMVCYKALYGSRRMYVRPLEMFSSLVDKEKYPNIKQEWRLEKYNGEIPGIISDHAKWVYACPGTYPDGRIAREGIMCSHCGYRPELAQKTKHCPDCGAYMENYIAR